MIDKLMFSGDMFISCHATRNEPKKRARGGDCAKRPLLTPPCAPRAHAPGFAYTIGVCLHPAVRLRPCEGVEVVKEGASQSPSLRAFFRSFFARAKKGHTHKH